MITVTVRARALANKSYLPVYVYTLGDRVVEVIPHAFTGLFFVFDVSDLEHPIKGHMLPLLTAQLKAFEVLGVTEFTE